MTRERGNDGGRTDGDRDGVDRDGGDGRGRDRPRLDRRTLVRTLGAGAAVGATGGLAAAQERAGESRTRGGATGADDAGGGDDAGEDDPGAWDDVVDPLFGFAGVFQENPPVEPDHVVELIIRPREGAPIPEFFFQPTGLSIEPGDTVQFSAQTPHHTVTAYHPLFGYERRVPEDVPAFSSPALQLQGYWLYTFDVEGVYDFHCAPHEVYGHAGRIVVGEDTSGFEPVADPCAADGAGEGTATPGAMTPTPASDPPGEGGGEGGEPPEPEPPRLTARTVLRDPALDPENILAEEEVMWDDLDAESKQLFLQLSGFPPCE